jgi:localization factor PodJL
VLPEEIPLGRPCRTLRHADPRERRFQHVAKRELAAGRTLGRSVQPAIMPAAEQQPAAPQTAPETKAPAPTSRLETPASSSQPLVDLGGLEADPGEITGSLPASRTDASLASIVAEPGTVSSKAELPPPDLGTPGLRQAAANGDAKAQFVVASRYLDGEGTTQDVTKAAYWYQEAASRGLPPAQYRIATLFERGRGVPKDVATALVWYERAAANGNVKSMHNAAVLAAGNELGAPDYDKAFRLFKEAAEHGLKDSQFNLAVLYERGLGSKVNNAEALFWYLIASRQSDSDAQARAATLAKAMSADEVAAARKRAEAWAPLPSQDDANTVSVTDPAWGGAAAATSTAPAATPAAPEESLNPIKAAQQLLMKLGFNVGEPDGRMGARTANAIRLYQLQSGLKVTGEISPELIETLQAEASRAKGA